MTGVMVLWVMLNSNRDVAPADQRPFRNYISLAPPWRGMQLLMSNIPVASRANSSKKKKRSLNLR